MKPYRHAVALSLLLTSCVVGSFSIVDQLPSGHAGAAGDAAGSASGGKSSGGGGTGNGGSVAGAAGKPQGGSATQGGSAPQAGEPTIGDAGEASGGAGDAGAPGIVVAPKACDPDQGTIPILCDDFEAQTVDMTKWLAPPGLVTESTAGPHGGNTRVAHLSSGQQLDSMLPSFLIDTTNPEVTISFWFKEVTHISNNAWLVSFESKQNNPIHLAFETKDIYWSALTNERAPTLLGSGNIPTGQWLCVSIYLTSVNMNFSYFNAAAPAQVQTVVVDDTPTLNVDDDWINNQPSQARKISGHPKFSGDPTQPADLMFDDIRIVRGKTNVCGL